MFKAALTGRSIEPVPATVPLVQVIVPLTDKCPLPPHVPPLNAAFTVVPLALLKFSVPLDTAVVPALYAPATFTVAPVKLTVPAPLTLDPAFKFCVPVLKANVVNAVTVKLPVLVPPPSCTVPTCTSTAPLLLNKAPLVKELTPAPADLRNVPALSNLGAGLPPQ
jgi:hypothetical protein